MATLTLAPAAEGSDEEMGGTPRNAMGQAGRNLPLEPASLPGPPPASPSPVASEAGSHASLGSEGMVQTLEDALEELPQVEQVRFLRLTVVRLMKRMSWLEGEVGNLGRLSPAVLGLSEAECVARELCLQCREPGHISSTCRHGTCLGCGQKGHRVAWCNPAAVIAGASARLDAECILP